MTLTASPFAAILLSMADDNGQIPWVQARGLANAHGLWDDFRTDYGNTDAFGGVDAGEFLIWLGY